MDQTICQRAFADGFHNEPAGNIMAFSMRTFWWCWYLQRKRPWSQISEYLARPFVCCLCASFCSTRGVVMAMPRVYLVCSSFSAWQLWLLHRQIIAVPDLRSIVTRRLVESVGEAFNPVVSTATGSNTLFFPSFASSDLVRCTPRRWTLQPLGGTGVAAPSPIQSSPPSSVWGCTTGAACSADLACPLAEQREKVWGRIRVSETPLSHCGQPVVCLVYTIAIRSHSTHHICSNTAFAELTTISNTPPTDSTNLRVTMQHKSGTAQIRRDMTFNAYQLLLYLPATYQVLLKFW